MKELTRVCKLAREYADRVVDGSIEEMHVPLLLRDAIRAHCGVPAPWMHTKAMKEYRRRLENVRKVLVYIAPTPYAPAIG